MTAALSEIGVNRAPPPINDALLLHSVTCCVLARCAHERADDVFVHAARQFERIAQLDGVDRDVARTARALAARFGTLDKAVRGEA